MAISFPPAGSSFTYITGAGGEKCFDPKVSLLTVKAACLFGVVEAARAQCRGGNVAVIEIRIATFVQPAVGKDNILFFTEAVLSIVVLSIRSVEF